MRRGLLALILTLIVGYGPDWSAYYVAQLVGNDRLVVLGDLNKYTVPCTAVETTNSQCTHAYLIPHTLYKKWGNEAAIGAGQIISAVRFRCVEDGKGSVNIDDPLNPGRTFDLFTIYQVAPLSALNCSDGVVIEAWSKKNAVRKGYLGGAATVGHYSAVDRVKRLTEFFTRELLFGLCVAFLILIILSERIYSYSNRKKPLHPYEITLPLWFLNSTIVSGVAQNFFSFVQFPLLLNQCQLFLTQISILSIPILLLLRTNQRRNLSFYLLGITCLLLAVLDFSPSFASYFIPIHLMLLCVLAGVAILKKEFEYIFLVIIIFLGCLKILGFHSMPIESATYSFYAFVVCFLVFSKIRLNARLATLAQWAQSSEWRKLNSDLLQTLIAKIHDEVGAGRTTLLSVSQDGQITIHSKIGTQPIRSMIRTELPPIFAHVFSIGEPLIHLNSKSDKYRNIARGALTKEVYQSEIFSIIPIISESHTVGAVAFTDYPQSWIKSPVRTFLMRHLTGTLESNLIEQIHARGWRSKGQWSEKLLEIQKRLLGAKNLEEAHAIVCDVLSCFGFLASLDPDSRLFSLHAIQGYPSEVDERLRSGRIYAHRENEQGPIAIAANQKKCVIIPDVKLLRSVLHENTNMFFEKSQTHSCVGIPVFSPVSNGFDRQLWGVLFLERSTGEPFTLDAKSALEQIGSEFSELLKNLDQQKVTNQTLKALSSFVPERVLQRVIHEQLERENDTGILVMIDLKSSTKIALKFGSEYWLERARALAEPLEKEAAQFGLNWQYFNWDAFYFTLSTPKPNTNDLIQIVEFFEKANILIQEMYAKYYSTHGSYGDPSESVARVCITYGDISRGFLQGATRIWTIVGSEMAAISKFEDLCKRLDGSVFCDGSLFEAIDSNWMDTGVTIPSTGRKIYRSKAKSAILSGKNKVNRAA